MPYPPPAPPRFDAPLGAWILSRFADVTAALRDPRLVVRGAEGAGEAAHAIREAGIELPAWLEREQTPLARARIAELPAGVPVDLVGAFARPWSLALALRVARVPLAEGERLGALAREVFLTAAAATGDAPDSYALGAAQELARHLGQGGPLAVQSFVALSQTLPGFLAAAWLALLHHPAELERLRREPDLLPRAIEELLRHSGPSRAVFRQATGSIRYESTTISPGDRVILLLGAANRDPSRFPDPDRLDLTRGAAGHVAFGWGAHACLGAQLVRLAVTIATEALMSGTWALTRAGEVTWQGGFAIQTPASLPVFLDRRAAT